jgi:hypothetical protein
MEDPSFVEVYGRSKIPSTRNLDYSVNNEIIYENPHGNFTSIDVEESIMPYCGATKGGRLAHKLEVIKENTIEEDDKENLFARMPTEQSPEPKNKVEKFAIEEALLLNSNVKPSYQKVRIIL